MPPTTTYRPRLLSLSSLCIGIPLGLCTGAMNTLIMLRAVQTFTGFLPDNVFSTLVIVFASGIIAGAIQGAFLRPYTRPIILWLVASGIGWSLAYGLMLYFYTATSPSTILPTISEASLGLSLGLLAGIAQWIVLQRQVYNAYWWMVSTVLIWGIGWAGMTYFFYAIMGPAL